MSTPRHRAFPAKDKDLIHYFCIRDTSLNPITAAWTGPLTATIVDEAGAVTTAPVVQFAGSHWGKVTLGFAQVASDAIMITYQPTNANARPIDILISTHDLIAKGTAPDSLTETITQGHARFCHKHKSDGATVQVYARDAVTILWTQVISQNGGVVFGNFF